MNNSVDINNPATLPLASAHAQLNRVVGVQTDQEGNATYGLYSLKVLSALGATIQRLTFAPKGPPVPGQPLEGVLTVWTSDGNSYSVALTLPPGTGGIKLAQITATQSPAHPQPGEEITVQIGGVNTDGSQVAASAPLVLPPGAVGPQGMRGPKVVRASVQINSPQTNRS